MNRAHRLQYCKICNNQKMDLKKGLVCRLTNEQATFETTCPDFLKDDIKAEKVKQEAIYRTQNEATEIVKENSTPWKTILFVIFIIIKILLRLNRNH